MKTSNIEDILGFPLENFDILDEFSNGFCYYDSHSHAFYTCKKDDTEDWWNEETMEIILECPYCESTVGGFHSKDKPYVKHWMGKHLALHHKVEVETELLKKEQREEYHTLPY